MCCERSHTWIGYHRDISCYEHVLLVALEGRVMMVMTIVLKIYIVFGKFECIVFFADHSSIRAEGSVSSKSLFSEAGSVSHGQPQPSALASKRPRFNVSIYGSPVMVSCIFERVLRFLCVKIS